MLTCCFVLSIVTYLSSQLGHNKFESSAIPRLVGVDGGNNTVLKNVSRISCGDYSSVCIADPGLLYTWGASHCLARPVKDANNSGVAPRSTLTSLPVSSEDDWQPDVPTFLLKRRVQYVISGDNHIIIKSGADVWAWGKNTVGQLGSL